MFLKMNNIINFWPILKELLKYGINIKKKLLCGLVILIFSSIAEVLNPILISYFIKNSFFNKILSYYSFKIIFYYLILQILATILNYYQDIIFSKLSITIIQKLRCDIMKATLNLSMDTFDQQPIGQFISRITNDTETIKELYNTVITTLFKNFILIITTLITMFILKWKIACISSIIFPTVIIIMYLYQKHSKPMLRKMKNYVAKIHNFFHEIINGMHIIQQFNQEEKFKNTIKDLSQKHYNIRMKLLKLESFLLRPLLNLFSSVTLCGLILLFGTRPIEYFDIGILYAFVTYLGRLHEPLITIASQQSIFQQAIVAGERVLEIIKLPKQQYGFDSSYLKTGDIEIKNLYFSYKKNSKEFQLKNINLSIPSGNFVAFVGRTGSGKSTLAKLIMGHYPIQIGAIYLNKRNILSLSHKVLKKGISIVQQDPIILNDTILENITLGKKYPKYKIINILKKIKLINYINSLPNGLYEKLGENGNMLSTGQKQLLSIARVLIKHPKILILDEATSNIDLNTENDIKYILSSIKKKSITLIVITHRLSIIEQADTIFTFKNGKIIKLDKQNL